MSAEFNPVQRRVTCSSHNGTQEKFKVRTCRYRWVILPRHAAASLSTVGMTSSMPLRAATSLKTTSQSTAYTDTHSLSLSRKIVCGN